MKGISKVLTGMSIGLAVGGASALIGSSVMDSSTKRMMKKKAGKTFKTMEDFLDDIQDMFKW